MNLASSSIQRKFKHNVTVSDFARKPILNANENVTTTPPCPNNEQLV